MAPYGYKRVKVTDEKGNIKVKLEVNPAEAETVRLIFQLYLQGDNEKSIVGAKNLAIYLNEKGYRTRSGGKWSSGSSTPGHIVWPPPTLLMMLKIDLLPVQYSDYPCGQPKCLADDPAVPG